jgi:hypothetical protein
MPAYKMRLWKITGTDQQGRALEIVRRSLSLSNAVFNARLNWGFAEVSGCCLHCTQKQKDEQRKRAARIFSHGIPG